MDSSFVIKIFRLNYDIFVAEQQKAATRSLLQKCQVYRLTPVCAMSPLTGGTPRKGISLTIVHVISLPGSPRRSLMTRQLEEVADLDWRFFDAGRSAPATIPYDPTAARRAIRRELTPGELGCYGSHYAVWQAIAAGDDAAAVVLEDDLLIDPGFFANLPSVVEELAEHPFVRLYAKAPTSARIIGRAAGRHVVRYRGAAIGAQGYILRREGARRWLESITAVVRPVDDEMERYWAHGIANIGLHPFPILERVSPSTIEDARRGIAPPRWHEFGWQWRRALESGRRRLANLAS